MMLVSWIINMVGIVISGIGSWYAYKGAPRDTIGFEGNYSFPYTREESGEIIKDFSNRQKFSRLGFKLLSIGFGLLAIAQLFVFPFN
ncbi:hypothetical protein QP794_01690 [Paenibacillus sp. UMB7766-LJ446]|uniref:hypothetical protein n=1 Tax=Paenibacillus sp. UMB7766-LJ446 TaxID=3046313 RepID=UPI00254AF5BF|nr:hypothetical protein [Paenibacillus sp. UMB7766-LJ446]MDK8188794.1 hypothetical protein [Paenibacillus sp. UMB7766-LJ446]